MIIANKKGNIIADCESIWISKVVDKNNKSIKGYNVVGTLKTGRNITLSQHTTESEAMNELSKVKSILNIAVDMATI